MATKVKAYKDLENMLYLLSVSLLFLPAGPFSKVTSSTGMHETTMGNVTIQVITGDITKETTDVIVNSSDEKFTLKSGKNKPKKRRIFIFFYINWINCSFSQVFLNLEMFKF